MSRERAEALAAGRAGLVVKERKHDVPTAVAAWVEGGRRGHGCPCLVEPIGAVSVSAAGQVQ